MGTSARTPSGRAGDRQPKILIEARMVQVNAALWTKLGVSSDQMRSRNVTIPTASLLFVLGDPNVVRITASARAEACVGETEVVQTGERMKFLIQTPTGALEPRTTDTPVGTTLTVQPLTLHKEEVLLRVEFTHSRVVRPQMIHPGSSLPVGAPVLSSQKLINAEVNVRLGEPMIAASVARPGAHTFILIRAEVLSD
jgi:hypothetical protein